MLAWTWHAFDALTPARLYALLKLRSDVFVVEQNCVFSDMDGLDAQCDHLCGMDGERLVAYLRVVPPGVKYAEPSIGRLVVVPAARRGGIARVAMERGLARCRERFGNAPVMIQAQAHLASFYGEFGFAPTGPEYLEDGIPHVDMRRA